MTLRIRELVEENQKLCKQLNVTETTKLDVANCIGTRRHGKVYKVLFESKVHAAKLLHKNKPITQKITKYFLVS